MAKFELYLKDFYGGQKCSIDKTTINEYGEKDVIEIVFYDNDYEITDSIYLDKSTAIKFAKTLRTEINKITESELQTIEKGNFTILTGTPKKGGQDGTR